MFKNKIVTMIIMIFIAITLIILAAIILYNNMGKDSGNTSSPSVTVKPAKPLSTKEVKDNTVLLKDIATNLASVDNVVRLSFAFELENKKTKADFENLLDSKIKATIILIINDMTIEELQGSKGTDILISKLTNELNPMLKQGKIRQISITDKVIQ